MLHADVERQRDGCPCRRLCSVHRIDQTVCIKILLDAANRSVVDVDTTQDMPRQTPGRIGTSQLLTEGKAGQTQIVHPLCDTGRQPAADPFEPSLAITQRLAQRAIIEIGKHLAQLLHRLVAVDDQRWISVKRGHFDIACQQAPAPVDQIRPRHTRCNRRTDGNFAHRLMPGSKPHELRADRRKRHQHDKDHARRA
ncbi:MAG TPA: hypothetical protein P5340_12500 [Defluviicoccus sp.]|nr:hypothetical protein [Defluviicoccus sp.]